MYSNGTLPLPLTLTLPLDARCVYTLSRGRDFLEVFEPGLPGDSSTCRSLTSIKFSVRVPRDLKMIIANSKISQKFVNTEN